MPRMSDPADLSAEMRELTAAAISKRKMGVEYGYDVNWSVVQVQTPAGPAPVVVWHVLLTRRSPLLGQPPVFHVCQIVSARPAAAEVDQQVEDGMRQMALTCERLKKPPQAPPAGPPLALANGHRS